MLQALRLADRIRDIADTRYHDLQTAQLPAQPRDLSYRTDEAITFFNRSYHIPPLVAIYLHRSTAYVISVLAALASG